MLSMEISWTKCGRLTLLVVALMSGSQTIRASERICESLGDVKSGFVPQEICESHLRLWQEQHELALEHAMARSQSAQGLREGDDHFQGTLRRCDVFECVRLAYLEQSQRLHAVDEVVELAHESQEESAAGFSQEQGGVADNYGPADTVRTAETTQVDLASTGEAGQNQSALASDTSTMTADVPGQEIAEDRLSADRQDPVETGETLRVETQAPIAEGGRSTLLSQVLVLSFWGVLGCAVVLMLLAATNQVVVFYDGADAFWSIAPIAFLSIGLMVSASLTPEGAEQFASTFLEKVAIGLAVVASAFAAVVSYRNAIHYNRSVVLGLMVGTLKLCVSTFMVLTVFGQLGKLMDPGSTRRQFNGALLIFMMIGVLWYVLINGRRVHVNKGWLLEQSA